MNPAEMGQGIYTSYLSGVPPQPRLARKGHRPSRTDARLAVIAGFQRSLGSGQFLFNQIRISHGSDCFTLLAQRRFQAAELLSMTAHVAARYGMSLFLPFTLDGKFPAVAIRIVEPYAHVR